MLAINSEVSRICGFRIFFFFFLTRSGCLSESLLEKPVSALTFLQEKVTTKYVSNRDDAGCMVVKG